MRRYCRKASANVRLFFELQNFFHFFFKKSTKNLVFSIQTVPKAGRTDTEEPNCQQQHSAHLPLTCVAKIVKGEWRTKQIHLFFIPSRILFSRFTSRIVKGEWRTKQVRLFFIPSRILFSRFSAKTTTNKRKSTQTRETNSCIFRSIGFRNPMVLRQGFATPYTLSGQRP